MSTPYDAQIRRLKEDIKDFRINHVALILRQYDRKRQKLKKLQDLQKKCEDK